MSNHADRLPVFALLMVSLTLAGCGSLDSAPVQEKKDASADAPGTDAPLVDAPSTDAEDGGVASCEPPCHAWARLVSGPSEEDEIDAVASDADGNVFISGKFEQELEIEGHDAVLESAGRADIMLAKLSPKGETLWVRHYGGAGEDNVFDAACDDQGNVILSGYFGASVDFGDITLTTTGLEDLDMMVVKVDPQGDVLWAVQAGGPDVDGGNEINVAPDGTLVALAGSIGDFSVGDINFAGTGQQDGYIFKIDPDNGDFLWGAQIAGAGNARVKCLTIDGAGNVFAGGDYRGETSVVGPNLTDELPASELTDAFISSWTPDGQLRWSKAWGGTGPDLCKGAVATEQGELYLVGYIGPQSNFDGEVLDGDGVDMFVWKLDDKGDTIWLNHVTSPGNLTGAEAIASPDGGVLFGHKLTADVTYGSTDGKNLTITLPEAGGAWPIVVGYTAEGVPALALLPERSSDANADEISRSGRRIYLDVPIFAGTYEVGGDVRSSNGTKDALIVAIDL